MDGLRYCEMLQYLTLLRWHTRRHVNQLSWLLSKLNTRFLSGIVVRCFGGLPVRDELETADVVLSQPSFENLQSIDFVLNSWDNIGGENLRCKLHEGLPTLTARRLVVLEFETNTASL
ncbi:hypothetical protein QCA50_004094 [Cerrena zonata]|uniref:Uncharacterized protein n=1 Tax=Cerrena zonata TaxID=2478898 RepID=A0AAW0GSG2_9APHY